MLEPRIERAMASGGSCSKDSDLPRKLVLIKHLSIPIQGKKFGSQLRDNEAYGGNQLKVFRRRRCTAKLPLYVMLKGASDMKKLQRPS
jgi:hypothetical protein